MSLTKKQKEVFEYICQYIQRNEYSPTQVEIQKHFNFKSLGSVQDYIRYLKNTGHLKSDTNAVRGLRPNFKTSILESTLEIPLHGKVAAGAPIETIDEYETVKISSSLLGPGEHFALRVSGDSMIEDGIFDGDMVILKKMKQARNGQTVVATINNEATVKRYYHTKQGVELHPANSSMSPIHVNEGSFEIKGILAALIRKY